jgi:hypothetical protein
MSRALPKLSDSLAALLNQFAPLEKMGADEVASLDVASVRGITSHLRLMRTMASNMEQELEICRLLDAGRVYASTAEQLATEAAATFILNSADNVVRGDFGRKR